MIEIRDLHMSYPLQYVPMRLLQLGLIFCLVAPVQAQVSDNNILDEIVVTATRMESSVRDVARSVSVVSKERIQGATHRHVLQRNDF